MHLLVTGADGFIGRNLRVRLRELGYERVTSVTRATTPDQLAAALSQTDFVFHLAGVNRPTSDEQFVHGNVDFTLTLCEGLARTGRSIPIVYTSSTQATLDNAYGRSKRDAEQVLLRHAARTGSPVHIFRLTNVFGKWCRPFYNSAVATFCHQVARGLPVTINDPLAPLRLVYVDDVVGALVGSLREPGAPGGFRDVTPVYETDVGTVVAMLRDFRQSRESLLMARVGAGLTRALYSTYVSQLPAEDFAYQVPRHGDPRGVFVEMLKTPDCGQFSYFTSQPGVVRGEHYHHSKTEKFLVIQGTACFRFRNIDTGATHEVVVTGGDGRIVETAPGWTHNVQNIGSDELIVMLWANEIFDREHPDTQPLKVAT
jgi:UDP-2-acetamido-2,6-beta-L-arabino-hexul-4-ose reductase